MELKDMILSTLAELDVEEVKSEPVEVEEVPQAEAVQEPIEEDVEVPKTDEFHFLNNTRERVLVLFEGFQSPNNKNIEAKVDLTLNFLEYLLASIDERLETLGKR